MRDGISVSRRVRGTAPMARGTPARARGAPLGPVSRSASCPINPTPPRQLRPPNTAPSARLHYWALGGAAAARVCTTTRGSSAPAHRRAVDWRPSSRRQGLHGRRGRRGPLGGVAPAALDHVRFLHLEVDAGGCSDAAALRRLVLRELERRAPGRRAHRRGGRARCTAACRAATARAITSAFEVELLSDCGARAATRPAARLVGADARSDRRDERASAICARELRASSPNRAKPWRTAAGSTFLARTFAPLLRAVGCRD